MVVGFQATLSGLCGAIGLTALAWLIGLCVLVQIGLRLQNRGERMALAIAVGYGLLSYLAFGLGMCGLLRPMSVRLLLLCTALGAMAWYGQQRRGGRAIGADNPPQTVPTAQATDENKENVPLPAWAMGLLAVVTLSLLAAMCQCLTPPVDYDGLAYHLAAPKRWLELGVMRALPTQIHSESPMGFEMLFLLLLPTAGPFACKPLVLFVTVGVAIVAYRLGSRLANPTVGAIAAVFCALTPGIDKINTTSIEMPLTYFTACSGLALVGWVQAEDDRQRRLWRLLAGFCAGITCCVKLNGLLCVGVLALAAFFLTSGNRKPLYRVRLPLWLLGSAVLCAVPWYLRAWFDTGNPIYPFAYRLLGGRYWNEQAGQTLALYFRIFNLPGATVAERLTVLHRHLIRATLLFLVAALLPSPRWVRGMAAGAGLFVAAQLLASDQLRFFLPALPFAALVPAWWIARLTKFFSQIKIRQITLPIFGWWLPALAALLTLPDAVRSTTASLPTLLSRQQQEAGLRRNVINYEACRWANSHLPPGGRVLMGMTAGSYFLERDVTWSNALLQQEIRYDSPEVCLAALQRRGIAYLMLDDGAERQPSIRFEIRVGWRAGEWNCLQALAARSTPIRQDRHITIYQLPEAPRRINDGR